MNIEPLRDFVLVELHEERETPTASGIAIVRTSTTPSRFARILAIGPDVREARVGDEVVISKLQGYEIDRRLVLPETAILATLNVITPNTCRHPELNCQGSCRAEYACND